MNLGRYLRNRLLQVLPVVLGIALLNFLVLQLAPGDVVDVLAGEAGAATPEQMAALRAQFGLDQPMAAQLLAYLGRLLTLDLGWSYRQNMPVLDLILSRLPATLLLMALAMGLALALGMLDPGGLLLVSTCAHYIRVDDLLDASRVAAATAGCDAEVLDVTYQPADHPHLLSVPESLYLKSVLLRRQT